MRAERRTDPTALAAYRRDLAVRDRGSIDPLFLGDSITEGWAYGRGAQLFTATFGPTARAFAVGGDHARHLLWRITAGRLLAGLTPSTVVLMIGANEMGSDERADRCVRDVTAVVDVLRGVLPSARLVLLGILPEAIPEPNALARIAATNARLAPLGDVFVDAGARFLTRGRVNWRLLGDGIHPTALGYRVLTEAVAPVLGVSVRGTERTLRDHASEWRGMVRGVMSR